MVVKDTNKRDIKFKEAYVEDGKFYDKGVSVDIMEILSKAYPNGCPFNLTITAKTEEKIDLPASDDSDE